LGQFTNQIRSELAELEDHRSRLEKDLQNRIQSVSLLFAFLIIFILLSCSKMVDVQLKFDVLSRFVGQQLADIPTEREHAKQNSLQQRLVQLMVVHRQLLRK
jgi:hypothetical protein